MKKILVLGGSGLVGSRFIDLTKGQFTVDSPSHNDLDLLNEKEIASYDKVFKEGYNVYGWDVEWEFEKTGRPVSTPEQVFQYMEYAYKKNSLFKTKYSARTKTIYI